MSHFWLSHLCWERRIIGSKKSTRIKREIIGSKIFMKLYLMGYWLNQFVFIQISTYWSRDSVGVTVGHGPDIHSTHFDNGERQKKKSRESWTKS